MKAFQPGKHFYFLISVIKDLNKKINKLVYLMNTRCFFFTFPNSYFRYSRIQRCLENARVFQCLFLNKLKLIYVQIIIIIIFKFMICKFLIFFSMSSICYIQKFFSNFEKYTIKFPFLRDQNLLWYYIFNFMNYRCFYD